MVKRIAGIILPAALVAGFLVGTSSGQQQWVEHKLLLKVGDKAWNYNNDQLKALATAEIASSRGTKKNPAIPLEVMLTKDTRLPLDRIVGVIVVGGEHTLLIEGQYLPYIKNLVLKFGPNTFTLMPDSEETYKALRPIWGKPRIEYVERIDVLERR
jgi:hypothetical protein